jgi:hypothetical protein
VSKEAVESILEHHGVKGMHWGIRNPESRVRLARRNKPPASSDFRKTLPHRGKPVHTLTNKQLKAVNERINLEQNYRRMNPSTLKKGSMAVGAIVGVATTATTIYNMYNSPAGKALISAGKKALKK